MTKAVMQFKITLKGISPKIWRRILVPASFNFFELHAAIQDAMEWKDEHLHSFSIAQKGMDETIVIEYPSDSAETWLAVGETRNELTEKIADYFGVLTKRCLYAYDFGDNWEHVVHFEREVSSVAGEKYPQCIGGENACPPEDCGGVYGYLKLQYILRHKRHPQRRELLERLDLDPAEFDPTNFDPKYVMFTDPQIYLDVWKERIK